LNGPTAGAEYPVQSDRLVIGRGTDADLAFDDEHLSRSHVVIELGANGFRIRDLDSTNGMTVNDEPTKSADLEHGDRFTIGQLTFQYVVQERSTGTIEFEVPGR
jgi:pSer/pThr/pTyr-binding forkhead associated (FHA) protein